MKEDLELYQNQYNYIVVSWTVGYIIGQLPSNFILTRVPAHSKHPCGNLYCLGRDILTGSIVWIPFLEIGWTIFTFALAGAKSYPAMLGLRFVVGLFEAGYWPALYYILGSWYTKREYYFRSMLSASGRGIRAMLTVLLQASLESATASFSQPSRLPRFSVASCRPASTKA